MTEWTEAEFMAVLRGHEKTDAQVRIQIPARSEREISVVRSGICSFHRGLNASVLSMMMLSTLKERKGMNTCPKCGVRF